MSETMVIPFTKSFQCLEVLFFVAKTVIKQRGTPLKKRKLPSKSKESYTIEYTLQEALDIFLREKVAEGVRERTLGEYKRHIKYITKVIITHSDFTHIVYYLFFRYYTNELNKLKE